jgi:hypothetical protein
LEPLTVAIGAAVGKAVFKIWFKDNDFADESSSSAIDLVGKVVGDQRAKTAAERQIARIAEKAADVLEAHMGFNADTNSEEISGAVNAVSSAIDRTHLNARALAAMEFEPTLVAKAIYETLDHEGYSDHFATICRKLIDECSQLIVDLSAALPNFDRETFAEVLRRESLIIDSLDKVFDELENIKQHVQPGLDETGASAEFEQMYRRALARRLDKIELFGLNTNNRSPSKEHNLTTAYISLSVSGSIKPIVGTEIEEGRSLERNRAAAASASIRAEQAACLSGRIVVKGEAGSGKTTLLQSLAVRAAMASFDEDMEEWNDFVPFMIRLRALSGDRLPPPEDFPSLETPNIAHLMPKGWVHDQLMSGRALLLIDGLDEVSEARREATRKWIVSLMEDFPACRLLVTSRPPAVPDGWLSSKGFTELELLPMSPNDVSAFISHWHDAVSLNENEQQRRTATLALAQPLAERIRADRSLRELAATPLLCAMLCAMNRDKREVLPSNRIALYEAAVQMLIHARDEERKIKVEDHIALDYDTKVGLLQETAFWMMQNGWSMCDRWRLDEFIDGVKGKFTRLPGGVTASQITHLLLYRSGILRSPVEEKIDFVHNAFKEYLAAKTVVSSDRLSFLMNALKSESWREVAVLAAALADEKRRSEFIGQLLARGDERSNQRSMYHLLALGCLETCTKLDPSIQADIRSRVQGLHPPRTFSEARALSAAGDLALPLLAKSSRQNARPAAAAVRGLRMIGSTDAFNSLVEYGGDRRSTVVKELLAAWPFFDKEDYARRVLSQSNGIDGAFYLDGSQPLDGIRYLQKLRSLRISFGIRPLLDDDYEEIGALWNLRSLWLYTQNDYNMRTLGSLSSLRALTLISNTVESSSSIIRLDKLSHLSLSLRGGYRISDGTLSPQLISADFSCKDLLLDRSAFSNNRLTQLGLSHVSDDSDLTCMRSLKALESLSVSFPRAPEAVRNVGSTERLTMLNMENASKLTSLDDVVKFDNLTHLMLRNARSIDDIGRIVELTKLKVLHFSEFSDSIDLSPLTSLSSLTDLYLDARTFAQVAEAAKIKSLRNLYLPNEIKSHVPVDTFNASVRVIFVPRSANLRLYAAPTRSLSRVIH